MAENTAEDTRTLEGVLRRLRALAAPCEPPIGVGAFDVLYASAAEIVVWYSPVRAEHRPGEVSIPTARLAAAWSALVEGTALDEAELERLGGGTAGGRWLLAVLAQLPGVAVRDDPLALVWVGVEASADAAATDAAAADVARSEPAPARTSARRRGRRAAGD